MKKLNLLNKFLIVLTLVAGVDFWWMLIEAIRAAVDLHHEFRFLSLWIFIGCAVSVASLIIIESVIIHRDSKNYLNEKH